MALWGNTDTLAKAPLFESWVETFDADDVTNATDRITVTDHQFTSADKVLYNDGTGGSVDGLTDGAQKFVKVIDTNTIELYDEVGLSTIVTLGGSSAGTGHQLKFIPQDIYFIDSAEAVIDANQDIGINSPGWWKYSTYSAADGSGGTITRHKAELLCAISEAGVGVADAGVDGSDDSIAADIGALTIATIADVTVTAPAVATLTPVPSINSEDAVFSYVWTFDASGGTPGTAITEANHPGFEVAADGTLTFPTVAGQNGDTYRVAISATVGGVAVSAVNSNTVTLTVN
jgi:hypothetical protein